MVLEPGQLVYAKVVYDGIDPADLVGEEREIARRIFGPVERVPAICRRVIASVIGGRSGKSYLATLRCLHLACTVPLDGLLAPGQRAHVAIICPDVDTAKENTATFVGACSHARLRGSIDPEVLKRVVEDGDTVESFTFKRPIDGRFVEVAVRAVRRGGANVRGRWYVAALLDEACLFYDSSYKLSDDQVFKALKPRIVPGGQLLLSSTPWIDSGVLYGLWESEFGRPSSALVAHAPTRLLRSNPHTLESVAAEEASDPENAAREFGAEFGTGAPSDWLDKIALKACDRGAAKPAAPAPGEGIGAGGDLGFARNSSALVVSVHNPSTGRVRVTRVEERRPTLGNPLRPSVVCGEFAGLLLADGAEGMTADGHYQETAREALDASGLLLFAAPEPDAPWALVRALVRGGLLDLPGETPEQKLLLAQLGQVKSRKAAKGRVTIVLPESRDGRHGDLAAAMALAVWAAVNTPRRVEGPPLPATGREAHIAALSRSVSGQHWLDRMGGRGRAA